MKKVLVVALGCLVALSLAAGAWAGDYKPEYKLSIVVGPTSPWGQLGQKFADEVAQASGGKIKIKCYFAGKLFAGKQTNEFMLLRQGVADFAVGSTINWSPQVRELNIFSLPFLFPDYKAVDAVKSGKVGKMLLDKVAEGGVISLGWGENGFREITNRERPIVKPEDLAGLKIRAVGSPIFKDTFQALGANPVLMNWGDAQTAFQQGTVDGQENPINVVIIPYKLWQYHKYITVWHYTIDPLILGISKLTWDTFSPGDQKLLQAAADKVCAWEMTEARKGLTGDESALQLLRDHGMEVTVLDQAQRQAFRDKVQPVWDAWTPKIGPEVVNAAVAEVEASQK
ncbi:MAG: DctP family TRAP transporter solute-binding subunit [Deltaproteobacteria bacterium]|nr:DctP family TRAP transporter solute-binding subunit [Deltaproteobacteria bacterium]